MRSRVGGGTCGGRRKRRFRIIEWNVSVFCQFVKLNISVATKRVGEIKLRASGGSFDGVGGGAEEGKKIKRDIYMVLFLTK